MPTSPVPTPTTVRLDRSPAPLGRDIQMTMSRPMIRRSPYFLWAVVLPNLLLNLRHDPRA